MGDGEHADGAVLVFVKTRMGKLVPLRAAADGDGTGASVAVSALRRAAGAAPGAGREGRGRTVIARYPLGPEAYSPTAPTYEEHDDGGSVRLRLGEIVEVCGSVRPGGAPSNGPAPDHHRYFPYVTFIKPDNTKVRDLARPRGRRPARRGRRMVSSTTRREDRPVSSSCAPSRAASA